MTTMPMGCTPAGPAVGVLSAFRYTCPTTGDTTAGFRRASANAASEAKTVGMSGLLGWLPDTPPSFHRLPLVFGNDYVRSRRLPAQASSKFPAFGCGTTFGGSAAGKPKATKQKRLRTPSAAAPAGEAAAGSEAEQQRDGRKEDDPAAEDGDDKRDQGRTRCGRCFDREPWQESG